MRLTLLATAALTVACAVAEDVFPIPHARNLPVVDGVIGAREYDEGVSFAGFLKTASDLRLADTGEETAAFLSDGKTLYVAWHIRARNVDHDGGLKSAAKKRDGAVWDDDSVELSVVGDDPDRIAHFIFNAIGTVYDSLSKRGKPANAKWNCDGVKVASKVNQGWWDVEVAVPFASIGSFRRGFRATACKGGPGRGTASINASSHHIQGERVPFVWNDAAPAVHLDSLGEPTDGIWSPRLGFLGGGKDMRLRVDCMVFELGGEEPVPKFGESKVIAAGETWSPKFVTRSRKSHVLELTVRDAKTGETYYARTVRAKRTSRAADIPVTAEKDLAGIGETQIFHYPGYGKARINVYPVPGEEPKRVAARIGGKTFALVMDGNRISALVDVPQESGRHPLDLAAELADGSRTNFKAVATLETRRWEWQGHSLGRDRIVIPPFVPLKGRGSDVDMLHRTYAFGAAGVPRSVKALGRELLAAPMFFEGVVDGRTVTFAGEDSAVAVAADGCDATVAATARAADVTLKADATMEYDGFVYGRWSLAGVEGKKVERLTLVVPLKDAEVPLMHVCMTDSLRANPTGAVPKGDGEVWNGTELNRPYGADWSYYVQQSVPYLWLGAEKRGISFFTDNTCGMELSPKASAVRLVRKDGVLRLVADFINVPSRLKDGHSFAFGFEATPVKTADVRLRREFQTGEVGCPTGMVPRLAVDYKGVGFWNSWARHPDLDDWRLFGAACRHVTEADPPDAYVALYNENSTRREKELEENLKHLPNVGTTPHYLWFKSCRTFVSKIIRLSDVPSVPFRYSDPTLNWEDEAEQLHFNSEWVSRKNGYDAASRDFLTPSRLEYIIYYYAKEISLGMKGVYFDDMFPMTCRNPDTCGRFDAHGRFHGDFGILAMRELVKRVAVVQHLAGCSPRFLQVHMTNCLLVPSFAFATSQLSWEDHYGEDVFQKRFREDYVRAESLGGQIGAEAVALDGIHRRQRPKAEWDARFRFLTRNQQALLLPAGVKLWRRPPWPPDSGVHKDVLFKLMETPGRFGAWEPDAEFTPYYEYDGSLGPLPEGLHVGMWKRGGKTLYVLGNQTDKDLEVNLPSGRMTVPAYDLRFYPEVK